jgi:hypothetical protein
MVSPRPARSSLMKHWYAVEVRQLFVVLLTVIMTSCPGHSNVSELSYKCGEYHPDIVNSYVIIGGVVAGAAWYTYRLSMGSSGRLFLKLVL